MVNKKRSTYNYGIFSKLKLHISFSGDKFIVLNLIDTHKVAINLTELYLNMSMQTMQYSYLKLLVTHDYCHAYGIMDITFGGRCKS